MNIFFDGALPVRKRPTRQDRLEKTRQQLENYRRAYPRWLPLTSTQTFAKQTSSQRDRLDDARQILWQRSNAAPSKNQSMPPPPFMVASVIESLRSSKWSDVTFVVPGEADEFCAAESIRSDSAILSNDSDLLLYELETSGVIVVLHSLQLVNDNDHAHPCQLKAQCFRPLEVARRLGVPSMLSYGYQRFCDIGPRSAVIAQRARENSPHNDDESWLEFKKEYRDSTTLSLQRVPKTLQTLDPRVAEIICSSNDEEALHLYFPIVLEDPNRDSAWSYGLHIRQLAYSMLLHHWSKSADNHCHSRVTEYSRRGARIGDNEVSSLSEEQIKQGLRAISDVVGICRSQIFGNASAGTQNAPTSQDRSWSTDSQRTSKAALDLHLLAACIIITQRPQKSDMHKASSFRLFESANPGSTSYVQRRKLTWEDLHFFAALQSTLYSLRLFKQVAGYIEAAGEMVLSNDPSAVNLLSLVNSMPEIADLFVEATGLQHMQLCCDRNHIERLFELVDRYNNAVRRSLRDTSTDAATSSNAQEIQPAVETRNVDVHRRRSDLSKGFSAGKARIVDGKFKKTQDRVRPPMQETRRAKLDTKNMFTVLGQD